MRKPATLIPLGLVPLGFTLALASAASADTGRSSALQERKSGVPQHNRDYLLHRKLYGNAQDRDRRPGSDDHTGSTGSGKLASESLRAPDSTVPVLYRVSRTELEI